MGDFTGEPPQGYDDSQQLQVEIRSHPRIQPPQGLDIGEIPPSADTELIEESVGVFDDMVFDDGTETGTVLVEE